MEAAGPTNDVFIEQAVERAAVRLEGQFTALLLSSAKLAAEYDRPAHAALELALTRSLATTLASQGEQLSTLAASQNQDLGAIKQEMVAIRDAFTGLPGMLSPALAELGLAGMLALPGK
jgi:hypothetical protein